MYRLTTPEFTFTFPTDFDMSTINVSNTVVTFSDSKSNVILEKTGNDLNKTGNNIIVFLTQEETQLFAAKKDVKTQINWKYIDGSKTKRACTNIVSCHVDENLHNEVM